MLKFKLNETLTWDIDWINDVFVSANYIALVDSIVSDGTTLTQADYSIDRYTIILNTAPTTSLVLNHFYREELDIVGEGTVEFWELEKFMKSFEEIIFQRYMKNEELKEWLTKH